MRVLSRTPGRMLLPVMALLLLPWWACAAPETATVTQVIDGDTIIIGTGQRVRYIGINAPELLPVAEAYGDEAWKVNRQLVEGKEVRLERDVSDTDQYGRLLRYVYVDKIFINAEMVRVGLAKAVAYPPDTRNHKYFEGLEAVARQAGRGMWAKEQGAP